MATKRHHTSPVGERTQSKRNIPKNIIFCFDGTGNEPEDAIQPTDLPEQDPNAPGLTNVAKLHLLLGGDFQKDTSNSFYDMPHQVSLYYSGVGTHGGTIRRKFNYLLGTGDVISIVNEALDDLRNLHKPGDDIFVLGFSRGAAIARRFCGTLSKKESGLSHVKVKMLIAFDTVASIGLPDLSTENRPPSDVVFENHNVAPNVIQALHCVSLDDKRRPFQPTLMNAEDRVTEVWFAGNHSDVGGGWYNDGLSDVVLQFVLDEFKRRNVGLLLLAPDEIKLDKISQATEDVIIQKDDIDIKPDCHDVNHEQEMKLWHYHRKVVVIRNDQIVQGESAIVHNSVVQRIKGRTAYRPQSLVDQPHKVLYADGTYAGFEGLKDHLKDLPALVAE